MIWSLLLHCSAEEIKWYQEFLQHSFLTPSALLESVLDRGEEWVTPGVCTLFDCLQGKEKKQPLLFLQHKEFTPINKRASFIHLFTHLRTQQGHDLATIKYGKITIISRPQGRS